MSYSTESLSAVGFSLGSSYRRRNWRDLGYKIIRNDSQFFRYNDYPTTTRRILEGSYTGAACRRLRKNFIIGQGFEDETLNRIKIGYGGLTAKKLLSLIAHDLSTYEYYGFHTNFNLKGEVTQILRLNPEHLRKGLTDSFGVNATVAIFNDWLQDRMDTPDRMNVSMIDHIPVFDGDIETVFMQMQKAGGIHSYKGQVYVNWGEDEIYPKVIYDAVLLDMLSEGRLRSYNYDRVDKGFTAQHIFFLGPEMEAADLKRLKKDAKTALREDIAFMPGLSKDQVYAHDLSPNNFAETFTKTEESSRHSIIRSFLQPFALHSEDRGGSLGNSGTELVSAYQQYNSITQADREKISEDLSMIFANYFKEDLRGRDWSIKPLEFELNVNQSSNSTAE